MKRYDRGENVALLNFYGVSWRQKDVAQYSFPGCATKDNCKQWVWKGGGQVVSLKLMFQRQKALAIQWQPAF